MNEFTQVINAIEADDPQAAEFVQLRYFAGLKLEESAQLLKNSFRSASRIWAYARAWLRREIEGC
tara:strand:- start:23230 stop:23424 length:195 start_codon:yes stop_codon:yes gene_type:complete